MARIHQRVARKDYPAEGIKKGDSYFTWKTRVTVGKSYMGRVHRSMTRPTSTSSSEFQRGLDQIAVDFSKVEQADDLRSIAQAVRELGEECREKFDNMPEGLQQGDTGCLLDERATGCEEWADSIEGTADEVEIKIADLDQEEADSQDLRDAWDEYDTEYEAWDGEGDEPPEPDEADPRNRSFDDERQEALDEAVSEAESESPF